jgi:hypothetical protein
MLQHGVTFQKTLFSIITATRNKIAFYYTRFFILQCCIETHFRPLRLSDIALTMNSKMTIF